MSREDDIPAELKLERNEVTACTSVVTLPTGESRWKGEIHSSLICPHLHMTWQDAIECANASLHAVTKEMPNV